MTLFMGTSSPVRLTALVQAASTMTAPTTKAPSAPILIVPSGDEEGRQVVREDAG